MEDWMTETFKEAFKKGLYVAAGLGVLVLFAVLFVWMVSISPWTLIITIPMMCVVGTIIGLLLKELVDQHFDREHPHVLPDSRKYKKNPDARFTD